MKVEFQISNFKFQMPNKKSKPLETCLQTDKIGNWKLEIKNSQLGQTLIEVLIAIGIAVVVVSSMTIAVTSALSNAAYSKNQSLATEYAQEGMEIVRNEKLSNYQTFSGLNGRYCLDPTCTSDISTCTTVTTPANCAANLNNSQFIRQVDILQTGSNCLSSMQANVSVLWTDGKCQSGKYCHTVSVVSCFSNAGVVQGP